MSKLSREFKIALCGVFIFKLLLTAEKGGGVVHLWLLNFLYFIHLGNHLFKLDTPKYNVESSPAIISIVWTITILQFFMRVKMQTCTVCAGLTWLLNF